MAYLPIDIEAGGKNPALHPLVAVGTCFYGPFGLKEKRLFVFAFDVRDFEPRCVSEFWSKHPDKLQFFQDYPTKSTLQDFVDYVDALDTKYANLTLVTDNPAFDIGFLNAKLSPRNLQYPCVGGYRIPIDTNSFLWAMLVKKDPKKYVAKGHWVSDSDVLQEFGIALTSVHDHRPDNDAEWIGDLFMAALSKNTV
jgi:hypothetical protein